MQTKKTSTWRTILIIEELERELTLLQDVKEQWLRWEDFEERRTLLDREIGEQSMILEELQAIDSLSKNSGNEQVTLQDQVKAAAFRRVKSDLCHLQHELSDIVEKSALLLKQINEKFNPFWGMLFREGHQYSYLGEQVLSYACLYTSRVTNLLKYMPNQYFRPPLPLLPHDMPDD